MKGIPVKWRTQELCPIQCDVSCSSYSPCISACPLETCDNMVTLNSVSHLCAEDACVEGCLPKSCPENEIYKNETFAECVPKETCKPFCLNVNGVSFKDYEFFVIVNIRDLRCMTRGKFLDELLRRRSSQRGRLPILLLQSRENSLQRCSLYVHGNTRDFEGNDGSEGEMRRRLVDLD